MTKKKSPKQEGTDQTAEVPSTTRWCKLCEQDIDLGGWGHHLFYDHGGLTEELYDDYQAGQQKPKVIDTVSSKPIPPPPAPPPPPPEPKVEIRLMDIESNPRSVIVEMRRGRTQEFKRGEWVKVPGPDAWLLLPTEGFPGRYAHLQFERKAGKTEKRPAKAKE